MKLVKKYEDNVYSEDLGTRRCIVYVFRGENDDETIVYMDKEIG